MNKKKLKDNRLTSIEKQRQRRSRQSAPQDGSAHLPAAAGDWRSSWRDPSPNHSFLVAGFVHFPQEKHTGPRDRPTNVLGLNQRLVVVPIIFSLSNIEKSRNLKNLLNSFFFCLGLYKLHYVCFRPSPMRLSLSTYICNQHKQSTWIFTPCSFGLFPANQQCFSLTIN